MVYLVIPRSYHPKIEEFQERLAQITKIPHVSPLVVGTLLLRTLSSLDQIQTIDLTQQHGFDCIDIV